MAETLEDYYRLARPGSLACVFRRDDAYGDQYIFTRVIEALSGKIRTSFGTFWAINGERCDTRWHGDKNQLVVPTIKRLEIEEAHLTSIYQFGTDRKFELAAARSVLERRTTRMPEIPPPPVPTPEEAETELREATAYWMEVDSTPSAAGNSVRVRREASERLAAARTNAYLASRHRNSAANVSNNFPKQHLDTRQPRLSHAGPANALSTPGFSFGIRKTFWAGVNDIDMASYVLNSTLPVSQKKG